MTKNKKLQQLLKIILILVSVLTIIVILWIDVTTNIWQERVILAALAASMVSFLGTYAIAHLLINRIRENRWAPVTSLALTDLMRSLADINKSEITRGKIIPRKLHVQPISTINTGNPSKTLAEMLQNIHNERNNLTLSLARWSQFLASTGDNESIMKHVARVSLQLEVLGDKIIELTHPHASPDAANNTVSSIATEQYLTQEQHLALEQETTKYNSFLAALLVEIQDRLHSYHVSQRS